MTLNQLYFDNRWLEDEVNKEYKKFVTKKEIKVFIGTWNVNGKSAINDISSWVLHEGFDPDIYVFGFQEIVDLNAANIYFENDANLSWEQCVQKVLPKHYVKIASRHLVGILLLIYVKEEIKNYCRDIITSVCGVGLFGTAGNKGAVGVRMKLYDSEICFICAHLAAHKNNIQGRNQDYAKIIENLKFSKDSTESNDALFGPLDILRNHDTIFWFGDLNYRINHDDLEFVYQKIEEKDWNYLLKQDQLIQEKEAQHAFEFFMEKDITFQPTYKFQPGTSNYEKRPDKKLRMPAWCDRILWRKGSKYTSDNSDVECKKYQTSMDQTMSDHKPIYSFIYYKCNIFDEQKKQQIREKIKKKKDKWENGKRPYIRGPPEVAFQTVKYGDSSRRPYEIENIGQVPATFTFKFQPNSNTSQWLKIEPNHGYVLPQNKITVNFEICITSSAVKEIMSKQGNLEDFVIFQTDGRGDTPVTVSASYLPSCFGNSIELLVKHRQPIRFADTSVESTHLLSVPKELWRLVDCLYKYAMDVEYLFVARGIASEISEIRECLDTGKPFSRYDLLSVGEALIRFLESVQDPIFPLSLCSSFKQDMDVTQWCRQTLMSLPLSHYNTFIYIISFLREVLKHSQKNRLTSDKLAYHFANALMQTSFKDENEIDGYQPFQILRHFLTKVESL